MIALAKIKRKKPTKKLQAKADGPGPKGSWTKGWPSNPQLVGWALISALGKKELARLRKLRKEQRGIDRELVLVHTTSMRKDEWVIRLNREQAQLMWQTLGGAPLGDSLDRLYEFLDQTFGDQS